jgi:hypothetical protein
MSTTCTVTATICDPSQTNLLGNAFVRFRLRNFQGFVPTVQTSNVFCETQIDALPNPAGVISQVLTCNTAIYPINTFYTVEFWNQGRPTSSGNYYFNGNTSLNTAATINPAPAPQGAQSIVLENNGALNSSQTTLNLENTDGSVVITDQGGGALNIAASGASFSTSGVGGFWSAGFPMQQALYTPPSISGITVGVTPGQVSVFQFQLTAKWTISSAALYVVTGAAASTVNAGIYNSAGSKLIDSGGLNSASSSTSRMATFAPVTLPPGTYYFAQSTTSSGVTVEGFPISSAAWEALLNASGAVKVGQAANSTVGSSLPATLGTITSDSLGGVSMAGVFFGT